MSVTQGQTTYTQFPAFAVAGQLATLAYAEIMSFVAIEVINPGRAVMINADGLSVQQWQQSGATTPPGTNLGVALILTARESGGPVGVQSLGFQGLAYQIGDTVPVLMRGQVYAAWSGTTQTAFSNGVNGSGLLHVNASSTVATNRGIFTDAAVSSTAGTEVLYASSAFRVRQALPGTGSIILLDVNLPNAA